jgi:alpha/beta superfamily hydrolase
MDNKVVHTLARTLEELGLATVRFNFRGVGKSDGVFDDGVGETDDARAVCRWARVRWDVRELWLAGFSFGAFVAARLAAQDNGAGTIAQLITIAPPVRRFATPGWVNPTCPWLIVQGDHDDLVDVNDVRRQMTGINPPPRLVVLAGVDHFFHGRLHELKDTLRRELAGDGR